MKTLKVGTKVQSGDYVGTVVRVLDDIGMVEIRFPGGVRCEGASTYDGRYKNCYVIEQNLLPAIA